MTGMEVILIAGLFGVIGLGVFFLWRGKQPENGQDFAELRGQIVQMASQSNELQRLITEQMAQSEGRLGNRLEQSLRDQNDRTTKSLTGMAEKLVVITEANTQISALTNQVTQLQNILIQQTGAWQFWRGAVGKSGA